MSDRRSHPRWGSKERVLYKAASVQGAGYLANVSHRGVFVRAAVSPLPEEAVELVLASSLPTVTLHGHIRWVGRRADGVEGFGAELTHAPLEYLCFVDEMPESSEVTQDSPRRIARRIALTVPVAVEFGTFCDEGTLCDISLSGARLERTGVTPPDGSEVRLTFTLAGHSGAFQAVAHVVRRTPSGGFAVQFAGLDARLEHALEQILESSSDGGSKPVLG